MSKQYYIRINGERIPVSEEVYRAYQRPNWREKKQKIVRDVVECSYDAMCESGQETIGGQEQRSVDEIIMEKLMLNALIEAIEALNDNERNLIYALFYKGKSERSYSDETSVPRKTLAYRKKKVFEKLRMLIENN